MILKIRHSAFGRIMSICMIVIFSITIVPIQGYGLTGGPAQPEFNAFTPIGTSDMVDLGSGDFSYNIPIMDIGGFPINLAYSSGVTMDQESSWVGLGWNLSIGQINRQMRGLPDDFDGEKVKYENNVKDNYTVGASFTANPALFGVDGNLNLSAGISAQYNSYAGMSMTPSAGLTYDVSKNASLGLNVKSTPGGLTISPNLSLHAKYKTSKTRDNKIGGSVGLSFNSRQGLSSVNMSATRSSTFTKTDKDKNKTRYKNNGSIGSSISFVDNYYTPTVQDGLTSVNFTFNAALGGEFIGIEGQGQIAGFGSNQYILESEKNKLESTYGYEFNHIGDKLGAVLDFNREKDGNFSVNSTNLPLTNYTYDIYNVQGQGVGGMFRPYRSQVGSVSDNATSNFGGGGSLGIEIGAGNAVHAGVDVEVTVTNSYAGKWEDDNLADEAGIFDSEDNVNPLYEETYFKNVGDLSVDEERDIYGTATTRFGGLYPIRLAIEGGKFKRKLSNEYEIKKPNVENDFNPSGILSEDDLKRKQRVKKNQSILKVKLSEAKDAEENGIPLTGFKLNAPISAGDNQTAGFVVTRNDGARYVYGEAIYNTVKREATFAVGKEVGGEGVFAEEASDGNVITGLVDYLPGEDNSINNGKGDHFFNRVSTPAYAHTYLLSTLLSTDYSDIDGVQGPSAGDFGSYTNFEYRKTGTYKWRVPFQKDKANYNEGLKTDPTDDKASYVYGEKEASYIQKIETKTHVALFYISARQDGYGVANEDGGLGAGSKMYKLDKVALYSRGEFYNSAGDIVGESVDGDGNITTTAIPIKTAHLEYDYSLCKGIPNSIVAGEGKLTLKKVYFTYRNSSMGKYSSYDFTYGDIDHNGFVIPSESAVRNPTYNLKGYDIWGNFKRNFAPGLTPGGGVLEPLTAPEFNYVEQDDPYTDDYTAAWTITDIELPSGGKIKIDYEADDYQYVQDKKAMQMFKLAGAGPARNPVGEPYFIPVDLDGADPLINQDDKEALLFKTGSGNEEAHYLYFKLPEADQGMTIGANLDFYNRYLKTINEKQTRLVQFRVFANMTHKGGKNANWEEGDFDYITGYFEFDSNQGYEIFQQGGVTYASIRMMTVDMEGGFSGSGTNVNPISKAGWHFGRKFLAKYIYGLPETESGLAPSVMVETILQAADNLLEVFRGANGVLRGKEVARRFIPEKSWIRLSNPNGSKKGGGCRVKKIVMTDEWAQMTSDEDFAGDVDDRDQKYGQEYDYNLEDGTSSGVATYEPIGSKENPLIQPVFVNVNRLLAPDEENYVEKPFGESFFPSPTVTYSRVAVKNIERVGNLGGTDIEVAKHATGKVITEFFTSKDYPVMVDQTKLKVEEDEPSFLGKLLNINVKKHITLSQGYIIHLNDMNGKMKSQRVYAEGKTDFISGVDYIYDGFSTTNVDAPDPFTLVSHNKGYIDNNVKALYPDGTIKNKTLGVEYDVINDFREMSSATEIVGINGNLATFFIGVFPGIVPIPLPDYAHHEDQLRMAITTKVVNTFGIQREVIAHDAGASVSTRNLLWDAFTGEVLVTQTVNEYGDKYYSMNLPAHWHYSGMGMASLNVGTKMDFLPSGLSYVLNADIPGTENDYLHNGDEVLIGDVDSDYEKRAWVENVTGTSFDLLDDDGNLLELLTESTMRIMRSGRRNIQSTSMGSIVLMKNPVELIETTYGGTMPDNFLSSALWNDYRIINAGAVEFKDLWDFQCQCGLNPNTDQFNPYRYNTKGIWRANKSHLYLTGRHHNTDELGSFDDGTDVLAEHDDVDPRNDGFYNHFSSFYKRSPSGWYIDDTDWTFTSEVSQFSPYGFELENKDALDRYSAAQYGYNFSFPLAVGANSRYEELGFDGFEDYSFDGCETNEHFGFRSKVENGSAVLNNSRSHTGKWSLRIPAASKIIQVYSIKCQDSEL